MHPTFDINPIDAGQYAREKAICDRAAAYAESVMREGGDMRKRNYLTAEEAQHPDYAACNNDMRGRVEQFEILNNPPETLVAYLGEPDTQSTNYAPCRLLPVMVWTGRVIGTATRSATWRVNSYMGTRMGQFYARIAGREYTGRSFGEGMAVVLRETAASKRKRTAA